MPAIGLQWKSEKLHWNIHDKAHAIADHLYRSSEGAVVCLAEACRQQRLPAKQQAADHCAGSILECAACFDLARIKALCSDYDCKTGGNLESEEFLESNFE